MGNPKPFVMFLDDERFPPDDGQNWVIARSHKEAQEAVIEHECIPSFISFDHDLGEEKTGLDVAHLIANLDSFSSVYSIPDDFSWYVHSQNPVGRDNINMFLKGYMEWRGN